MNARQAPDWRDKYGRPLAVGDEVRRVTVDDGAPLWALSGTVVGFGRTRVYVQWTAWSYEARKPHHATYGTALARTYTEREAAAAEQIKAAGYELRYVEYCEDADTPGFPGHIMGATSHTKQVVKIGRRALVINAASLADVLEHEARHVTDPGWDCGNRDVFGRGGKR